MEIVRFENISFDVAKYDIIRHTQYVTEKNKFHAPSDMKFFLVEEQEYTVKFEDKEYHPMTFVGLTTWSEEKEKISQNMHWSFQSENGEIEEDDYPCVNSWGVDVVNIGNKYLIWKIKNCCPVYGEVIPFTKEKPCFDEPVYLVKKAKDDGDTEMYLAMLMKSYKDAGAKFSDGDYEEILDKTWKTYQYIKVYGLSEQGDTLDCTKVTLNSWIYHQDVPLTIIERENTDFDILSDDGQRYSRVYPITKEEYEKVFNETLNKF